MDTSDPIFARMVALRRDLHAHPELSGRESRTAERIAAALGELGLSCRRGVGGHGLVVDLPGLGAGPRVALRADLDALPIQEETGLPFASGQPGVMHACGHDGHSAALVGAAALLLREPPPGPVRLIWQPAEEVSTGALAMIADGVLDGVEAIFGGHLDPRYPVGQVVVTQGAVNAATDLFRVEIVGKGAHGARPHEGVDALAAGAVIVAALQSVVAREIDPARPAVLSVCRFEAGGALNVIAGRASLGGTMRSHDPDTRARLQGALRRICEGVGRSMRAEVAVVIDARNPALINTPEMAEVARRAAGALGAEVGALRVANMGGEDFAHYLGRVPGCYVRFGAGFPDRAPEPAHSGGFDFDERALVTAARWLAQMAR